MRTARYTKNNSDRPLTFIIQLVIIVAVAVLMGIFIWKLYDYKIEKIRSGIGYKSSKIKIENPNRREAPFTLTSFV